MAQGQAFNQPFKVDPGMYYVVFDHTPTAGVVPGPMPMSLLGVGDSGAVVSYAVQIGDAP